MDWKSTAQGLAFVAAPLVVAGAAVAVAHVGGAKSNPRRSGPSIRSYKDYAKNARKLPRNVRLAVEAAEVAWGSPLTVEQVAEIVTDMGYSADLAREIAVTDRAAQGAL